MTFKDRLVELRQAAGLTQGVLATASGVPLSTLRNYERSKTASRINFGYVVALAKALGVDCTAFAACTDVVGDVPPSISVAATPAPPAADAGANPAEGKRK